LHKKAAAAAFLLGVKLTITPKKLLDYNPITSLFQSLCHASVHDINSIFAN
jgi:hypothetical protein